MATLCLVATHLSEVNTGPAANFNVQTRRHNAPLPSPLQDNDFPVDHATCSQVLTTPTTGTILLRLIQGGAVVELTALSSPVPPLRVIFPATVIPNPAIFLWKEVELHLLAVTDIGSLHRVVIPLDGLKLWQDQTDNIWPREYLITNLAGESSRRCSVHMQGTHSVAVALPNGVLLRIEAESMGYDGADEEWVETVFHHGSFLSSLTNYLPLHSGVPGSSDIISLASHPWPTDIGHVWSLSRDRTLRVWKAKLGCVASKTLPSVPSSRDASAASVANAKYLLLDTEQQNLLKIFSLASEDRVDIYALAFIPISSSTTGGFFAIVDSSSDHLVHVGHIECPKHTAHCHLQDFIVHDGILYTLWDSQGQSMIEQTHLDEEGLRTHNLPPPVWKATHYAHEPELTPAYMEEQLLSPGSLTEKFLSAIMKPGVFSPLTLRTALDRYIDACLSLPGPPPPQLVNTYNSLCENIVAVVGCTVTLNRDPQTGGFQHANYWTALKRDWEGFVARCRDVERSARWPLAIGPYGSSGILVVERERVGSLVVEDQPIAIRRMLERDQQLHTDYTLLAVLWNLRSKLGPRTLSNLENRVIDLMHQEIAFSFAEILQDSARRLKFHDLLDDGAQEWFAGRLASVGDLDAATRTTIDCLGGFDLAVKHEEMEVELLTLPPSSEWLLAQAAVYSTTTVEARYDLSLCLIIMLFFLSDELQTWDPALLAEVFAVFRGVAMLRFVCSQPSEISSTQPGNQGTSSADDVITQMRNMNVSASKSQNPSKSSLIHLLVGRAPAADGVVATAHNCLDASGVLRSLSPARTTRHEVVFADQIKQLGFIDVTGELLSWLPRTPAATYLQSQVFLRLGRVDDAAQLLETMAGCIGIPNMTLEDTEALGAIIPDTQAIQTEYAFYNFAAQLFHNVCLAHEVRFSQLAIQVAPSPADTVPLWNNVVKGLTDLTLHEDAYATVMQIPFEKLKRELASQLALHMCEENAVGKLMSFDFVGIASEVEASLAFKARNADPRSKPSYSRILYTWYSRRGDYRSASLTMYQRARKLRNVINDPMSFVSLAEEQLEALSVSINALYLVDEKAQWILVPVVPDPSSKRQKFSRHIPESKYISSKYDAEIIHLSDMEYDCTLLRAQIDCIKREPALLSSPEYLLPPAVIVMRLAQANRYNQAMSIAQSLKVDMTDAFILLTTQCIRLTRNPGAVVEEDTSGWLLTDDASSWQGTPSDRGWRYLQKSLKRYDGGDSDWRYAKASLETILSTGRSLSPPPWLIDILDKHHPEYLIRISLLYENIVDAVNYTYALVLKSDKHLTQHQPSSKTPKSSITWLPYALIDQVLSAADAQTGSGLGSSTGSQVPLHLAELRMAVNNRVKKMQKLSQNANANVA